LIRKEFFGFQDSFSANIDTFMIPQCVILASHLYDSGELEKTRINWETHAETVLLVASLHTAFGQSDALMKNGD
jgi:hypothetical protein